MSSAIASTAPTGTHHRSATRGYWIATGLFCAIFTFSGLWYLVDPEGAANGFTKLGYADRLVYPVAAAKLLGVAAILWGRSRTLTLFAFAGFLYDLLLALQGHIAESDADGVLAVVALVAWGFAFRADRQRYGAPASAV